MHDAESPTWTLAQHLTAGLAAIMQIEAVQRHAAPEPVCHHFLEVDPVDPMEMNVGEFYRHVVPLFASAEVEFAPDRLEAWETVKPDAEWLQRRIPSLIEAAGKAGLEYYGWMWEPCDRQPIAASEIRVVNNRTS